MVWYGIVWCSMVWCGIISCGVVWFDVVGSTVQCGGWLEIQIIAQASTFPLTSLVILGKCLRFLGLSLLKIMIVIGVIEKN